MRITIDLTSLADNFSGFERFALNVTKEVLEQYNHIDYILIFKEKIYPDFEKYIDNPKVTMLVLPRTNKLWFYQVTLYNALRKIDSDIFFFPAFPSPLLFRAKGIINTIHDLGCWDCPETMTWKMVCYFRILYRNAAKNSLGLVTVSEFSKRRIQKILKVEAEKICVVYNGITSNLYGPSKNNWKLVKEKYGLPDHYFMCLSTLEPRKNLQLLLQVYVKLLMENRCSYQIVLAGRKGWKMESLLDGVPEQYMKNIIFTGYVEDDDLSQIYSHAKLFVFPSIYEGFGIPPLEAMAVGCQVVSSDAEAMVEILRDYAIYFKNNDAESLKRVLLEYMDGKYIQKTQCELIEYSKQFSYCSSVKKLLDFWNISK